ncbi:MAG: hypothetical protein D6737_18165 [Chloroflexi bacterium]|nr:MAG: hypothetical protein D6737_18165 [Chloroflexota bacterium]
MQAVKRHRIVLIVVMLIVAAFVARQIPGARTIDDAFITFRYSRNIVEGEGFVYNPGVRVLGTTTPLFTVLMAAIDIIVGRGDFPNYAPVVSGLADGFTAALLYLIFRKLIERDGLAILPGALWVIAPMSVTFAVGGMETSVNILWMVGAVYFYLEDRLRWLGVFAGLGLLTRIDAALWIAPLFGWQLLECWRESPGKRLHERIPLQTWIATAIIILPWLIFSVSYFGSPIPRSLSAKSVAYIVPPASALVRFVQAYATPFFEFDSFGSLGAMIGAVVYLFLSLVGLLYIFKRKRRLFPFVIYPWLYMAVFAAANPLVFRWYLAPPMPALMLGIIAGAWSLIQSVEASGKVRYAAPVAVTGLALLWGGMSLNAWDVHPDHGPDRPAPNMAWHEIELLYQDIGTQLREEYGVTPQTRVASADIGAVGYFSRATIIDTVGLVTPENSAYYPVDPSLILDDQNYAVPPQLIADTDPAYFVTMEAFVRLGLEQQPEFTEEYALLREISTDFYGTGMRLYGHR